VLLVFEIGQRCCSARVGLLSAAIYAVYPTALLFTVDLTSEALGNLWFLAFLATALRFAVRPTWGMSALAGLFLGAELLTRAACVLMLPLFVVWAIWQFRGRWLVLVQAAAIPVLAVACLVPWTIRNYAVFHHFIPLSTMGGSVLLQGNNDAVVTDPALFGYNVWDTTIPEYRESLQSAGDEYERDQRAKAFAVQWLKDHPDKWLFLARHKLWRSMTPFLQPSSPRLYRLAMLLSWGPVLVLSALALVPTLVRFLRERHPGWLIHLAIVHWMLGTVIFFGYARYRQPVEPLCIMLAVQAVVLIAVRVAASGPVESPAKAAKAVAGELV
jgi:hypothetical protein